MAISEPSIVNFDPAGLADLSGPTGRLFRNRYKREQFSYPRNLASDATRRHVIEFTVRVPDPSYTQTAAVAGASLDFLKSIPNAAGGALRDAVQNPGENIVDTTKQAVSNFINQAGSQAKPLVDIISKTDVNRIDGTTIRLYIPDTVNVSYNSNYDDTMGLTGVLGRPYFLAQAGASLFDSVSGVQGSITNLETLKQIVNKVGDNAYVRQILSERTGLNTEFLLSGVGAALNPQLQVIFQGVGFREHQFDFTLTPHSKQEAEEIKKIVEAFKFAAAPEIPTNVIFGKGIYFKVPDRFNIKFLYNGTENLNVHRITECVLKNVNVDYAPMGWSTFDDGNPVQTRLTLQFQETEIIDKTRIDQGY